MAYDHQEREQLDQFKAWWEGHGGLVTGVVCVVLLALVAWNGWGWYERREAAAASALYEEFERAGTHEPARAREIAGTLIERHGSTVYAALAALQSAKQNYEAGDAAAARAQLQWVVDKSGRDELALVARVRLAGVLLDAKDYDAALKLLAVAVPDEGAVEVDDRRGDIYAAQGNRDAARKSWQEALARAGAQHPLRSLIELKLNALPPP